MMNPPPFPVTLRSRASQEAWELKLGYERTLLTYSQCRASQEAWELKLSVPLQRMDEMMSGLARGLGIEIFLPQARKEQ